MGAFLPFPRPYHRRPAAGLADHWAALPGGLIYSRTGADLLFPDGPIIVLIHGLWVSSRYMVPLIQRLASISRVYAPDLPGYGKSYKPSRTLSLSDLADSLAAWMDALDLRKAHLLGNSFGCQILAELALRHPGRIDRLILEGPTVDPEARTFIQQSSRLLLDAFREPPALLWIAVRDFLIFGLSRIRASAREALSDPIEQKLPQIPMPTLVVRGERDPLVPPAWARRAAGLLPRGELKVVPGAAHAAHYSKPEELTRLIKPFLHL